MTSGRMLADWVTELCATDHAPTGAEVLAYAAATLASERGGLPPALDAAIGEGHPVTVLDEALLDDPPAAQDWLFAHSEQIGAVSASGPAIRIHRRADGSVSVAVVDGNARPDGPGRPDGQIEDEGAVALVTRAGLVSRLMSAGLTLAAAGGEIGQEIDRTAAQAMTRRSGYRQAYEGLAATERFFNYTAALAAFLAACERVATGCGDAVAVASTELLVAALAGGGSSGPAPELDPAWAQAELALARR